MQSKTFPESQGLIPRAATPAAGDGRIVRVLRGSSEVGSGPLLGVVGMWTSRTWEACGRGREGSHVLG